MICWCNNGRLWEKRTVKLTTMTVLWAHERPSAELEKVMGRARKSKNGKKKKEISELNIKYECSVKCANSIAK